MLVFDLTNYDSFYFIYKNYQIFKKKFKNNCVLYLIGTKKDLLY